MWSRLFLVLSFITSVSAASVKDDIQSVITEYETSVRANTMKIIEAKTEEEKAKHRSTIPSVAPFAARVLKIVEVHPKDVGSAVGVSWLTTQASGFPEGQAALKLLGTTHAELAGIAPAVKSLEYHSFETAEPILKAIREKNPNAEEKAAATYALGMQFFRQFEAASTPEAAQIAKTQAMDFFQEVVAQYSTVTIQGFPIADQAGRTLFEMTNLSVGSEVPPLEGKDVDGGPIKLSDHRGKHVVLIFWGGWCHACHGVLPVVNQFVADMRAKPVVVLGINTDIPDEARKAYEDYKVSFPNWSDGTTSGPLTTLFNLRNFPTIYLIGPDGKIVLKNTSMEVVRETLAKLK